MFWSCIRFCVQLICFYFAADLAIASEYNHCVSSYACSLPEKSWLFKEITFDATNLHGFAETDVK